MLRTSIAAPWHLLDHIGECRPVSDRAKALGHSNSWTLYAPSTLPGAMN